jgi:hypothetical protein
MAQRPSYFCYIASTNRYNNILLFKYGRTGSLKARLNGYNIGRPSFDRYFYLYTYNVQTKDNGIRIEHLVKCQIRDNLLRKNCELCTIALGDLHKTFVNVIEHAGIPLEFEYNADACSC